MQVPLWTTKRRAEHSQEEESDKRRKALCLEGFVHAGSSRKEAFNISFFDSLSDEVFGEIALYLTNSNRQLFTCLGSHRSGFDRCGSSKLQDFVSRNMKFYATNQGFKSCGGLISDNFYKNFSNNSWGSLT